ncbi:MAG: type II toxin-antitoxin system Phd/YefM family antitoxin [Candidatus Binatia bacterium]
MKAGVREIRDRFSHYLDQVRRGREIIITDRGRDVAVLLPLRAPRSVEETIARLQTEGEVEVPDSWEPLSIVRTRLKGRLLSELVLEERERGW